MIPHSFSLSILVLCALMVLVQGHSPSLQAARGVVRLRVRVKSGDATKGLARKRFFLIKGNLSDNRALVDKLEQRTALNRDCYYRSIGASEEFIRWLRENDCESVYCREITSKDIDIVPEFQRAIKAGEKELRSREIAMKWISTNLPDELRSGFYKRNLQDLQLLLRQAEDISKTTVMSVMTDRNGTAYFTDVEPGDYVISNILSTEVGGNSELWRCEIKVKPGDLTTERPFLISNIQEKNVKCLSREQPLPTCEIRK